MSYCVMMNIACPAPFSKIEEYIGLDLSRAKFRSNQNRKSGRIGKIEVDYDLPPDIGLRPPYNHDWNVRLYFTGAFGWFDLQMALIFTLYQDMTDDLSGTVLAFTEGGSAIFYDNGKELMVNPSQIIGLDKMSILPKDRYSVRPLEPVSHS